MSRFASLWWCECEYEVDGTLVYLWEPLHPPTMLTKDDRPSWDFAKITFYREKEKDWVHVNRHLMFDKLACNDVVCLQKTGMWVEVVGAQVVWRDDRWYIRWHGYTNSRLAKMAAAGFHWWKDPGRELPERM